MPIQFFGIFQLLKTFFIKNKSKVEVLLTYLGITFVLGFVLMAKWRSWEGADRFGPGLLTEYLSLISIFSFILLDRLIGKFPKVTKIVLVVLAIYSFYVHFNATVFRKSRCTAEHTWSFYCLEPPKSWPKY
jgi:uncharacterized membrane protein YuzA (DUF378 family)